MLIIKETDSLDILIQILQMMKKQEDLTSGFIFLLGDNPISWKSQQQKRHNSIHCRSWICKFDWMCQTRYLGIWYYILFKEIFNKEIKIKIIVDNKPCIAIA